jgi:hypothetical protein
MAAKPGGAIQGSFPSLKMGRSVSYTSTLERDLLFILEYEKQVLRYQEQPFVVTAPLEGRDRRYTPDYALWTETGQTLVECKPAAQLSDPHTQQQIAVGTRWASAHGWHFEVVTDVALRTGSYLANLKLLWRYSRLRFTPAARVSLLDRLADADSLPLSQLVMTPEAFPLALHLLFHHALHTDLTQPLTGQSRVWR